MSAKIHSPRDFQSKSPKILFYATRIHASTHTHTLLRSILAGALDNRVLLELFLQKVQRQCKVERCRSQIDNGHVHVATPCRYGLLYLSSPNNSVGLSLVADFLCILRHPGVFNGQECTRDRNAVASPGALRV